MVPSNNKTFLYHGSNVEVVKLELRISTHALDFGTGFYTTLNLEQAKNFAAKVADREHSSKAIVSVYEIDFDTFKSSLKGLLFDSPTEEWLDFVSDNRSGKIQESPYDFIFGPVANDTIFKTFIAYQNGILSKQATIERLRVKKLYNQLVLKTSAAIEYLSFTRSFQVKV